MALADYFLKIDGIPGESQDAKHKDEIHLESWSFGEANAGTFSHSGGGGAGKVQMQDFNFTAHISKASPLLFLRCASGEHIPKAVMVARKAGKDQQEYYKITLSDLLISSYNIGGSGQGDVVPMDQVAMNFAKIEIEYKEQKADGSLGAAAKAGWDLKKNVKV